MTANNIKKVERHSRTINPVNLDRKLFLVDDRVFAAFECQLEVAPDEQKMKALLERPAPWE